ncbi:hypothetical protein KM295_07940 [Natronomonas sp. F2-12]|jgi:predicted nuclease with TOPRIM domain|uniref:Uncharacterized protein n=1 Tax=Natronomonas aquatica TaxID=2841590 RepID=A0A9R1CT27_9EURY|nr:hypothetical protein [Natronomonas aquatica]MCQ4333410.1 hypothetical protein [Natronomonas aquatica]
MSRELENAARRIIPLPNNNIDEGMLEYAKLIIETRRRLSELRNEVSEIELSITGYNTQSELNNLEQRYQRLNEDIENLHEAMITQNLSSLEQINSTSNTAHNQLLTSIESGDIPMEIERLEQSLMMIGQQINSKTIAANSRMGITISLVATGIAVLSILV